MSSPPENDNQSISGLSEGSKLEYFIGKMKKTYVEYKGNDGYFIKEQTLNGIEDRLHKLMASGSTSKGPNDLIDLNTTLAELRQELQKSKDALAAARSEVVAKSTDVSEVKKTLGAATRVLEDSKKTWSGERRELISKLEAAQLEASKLKMLVKKEQHSGDPEAALEAEKNRQLNAAEIQTLQNQLQQKNAFQRKLEDGVKSLEAQLVKLKADHTAALEANRELEIAFESQGTMDFEATTRRVEIKSDLVKAFLGTRGLDWLQQADLAVRTDYRDRAFKLMQAARSAQSKSIKSFGDLFEIVFQWIKQVPRNVAAKIKPWIDEIEADFKSAKLKTLRYYRETLEAIIKEKVVLTNAARKGKKTASPEGQADTEPWYYTVFFYSWAIERRSVRAATKGFNRVSSSLKSLWSATSSSFNKFLLIFRSSSHVTEQDLLYEATEEEKLLGSSFVTHNVEVPHKNKPGGKTKASTSSNPLHKYFAGLKDR